MDPPFSFSLRSVSDLVQAAYTTLSKPDYLSHTDHLYHVLNKNNDLAWFQLELTCNIEQEVVES